MTPERKQRLRWWTLAVLSVSLVIIGLDNTILTVAIPTIQRDLNASASVLQWMVDSYVLVFAGLLLTMGSLGDRFGRKRALQLGLIVFGASSLGAAYAQSGSQLIAARAVMGIGGALIMPATLSIIMDVFPREERGEAIGVWTGMAAVGIAVGPALGGWLLERFWWGSVFFINVPVVALALAAGWFLVPDSRDPAKPRLDIPGAVLSMGALLSLVYAIIEAPAKGWLDPLVLAAFGLSVVSGAAFAARELRTPNPMLDLRLFRNPRFSAGAGAIALAFFALFGTIFIVTQYLQFVLGYSPLRAGLALTPIAFGMMAGAAVSHRLVARFGTARVVALGLTLIAAALAWFSFWDASTVYPVIGAGAVLMAFGTANAMAPSTEAVMGAVPLAKAGVGSAMNDTTRQVGGAFGIAIIGSILNSLYGTNVDGFVSNLPAQAAGPARDSVGAAMRIAALAGGGQGEALAAAARNAFVDAMGVALIVAAAVAFVGALLVLRFMPARDVDGSRPGESPSETGAAETAGEPEDEERDVTPALEADAMAVARVAIAEEALTR